MDMLSLKNKKNWLLWRYEDNPNGKPLKVPYYASGIRRHGKQGSPEDIAKLVDFASAKLFAETDKRYDGVGLALTEDLGITCLDFDNCVSDCIVPEDIEHIVLGTYAEISPSGNGIRAFVLGNLGNSKSPTTDSQYGFELFSTKGFVTFTEQPIELTEFTGDMNTIAAPTPELLALITARFGNRQLLGNSEQLPKEKNIAELLRMPMDIELIQDCLYHIPADDYDEWLRVGMALHYEYDGAEQGFTLWDSWSANSPKYSTEELNRFKWNSFNTGTATPVTGRSLMAMSQRHGGAYTIESEIDFQPIEDEPEVDENRFNNSFNIRTVSEFMHQNVPIKWLIKGFLPQATLGVLYGASGSGKSFVVLDMCAALVRQVDWNGLRCSKEAGSVLYVVAEGVGGFSNRLSAYCTKEGIRAADLPIDIISDVTPNLTDKHSVSQLISAIGARNMDKATTYSLIIMDTFAQVTPGANENSGEDMGKALGYCRDIARATGAMVLLIHHSGKDASKGARGWSGVHAASDVVYEITRFEENRVISITKQKDGTDGTEFGFKLASVKLGEDDDGDDITSCVVEYGEVVKAPHTKTLQGNQRLIHNTLQELTAGSWSTIEHIVGLCTEQIEKPEGAADRRRVNIRRAIKNGIGVFIEQNENGEIRALGTFK